MTPSNRHPGTVTRRLRRALYLQTASGLLTALLAAPALAQDVIHFSLSFTGTLTQYKVGDDGTGLQTLSCPQTPAFQCFATAQSNHPGGRQYLYPVQDGQLPNGNPSYDLMVWSESSGQSKALTNIQGPLYVYFVGGRWSNDGLDSFVSFILFNFATGENYTYRAHVSATDIASPTFQPITLGDPRLELVKDWQNVGARGMSYWWSPDGSKFYYVDSQNDRNIWVKTVGGGDTLVYTAGASLSELKVSPASDAHLVATSSAGTNNAAILAVDLATSTSWYLATQKGTGLLSIRGPAFSPDGSLIAFGAFRTVKGTPYAGVYKVPFLGGNITKVREVMGPKNAGCVVEVDDWTTP